MSARSFFDTNVLVYAEDMDEPRKRAKARALIAKHRRSATGVVSIQVLQEYFAAITKKLGVEAEIARRKVELLGAFDVVVPVTQDVLKAIDLHRLHKISFWDALIINAAIRSGCPVLYSEDMQHHRDIDGVRILNPFVLT